MSNISRDTLNILSSCENNFISLRALYPLINILCPPLPAKNLTNKTTKLLHNQFQIHVISNVTETTEYLSQILFTWNLSVTPATFSATVPISLTAVRIVLTYILTTSPMIMPSPTPISPTSRPIFPWPSLLCRKSAP